ncbi:tRNA lysidine(34) synthetase TilS [Psychrobacter sp. I-STPA6b]|uniref:tRNA lysidine(34) synthetase TilS n=1 Tax=Psychrobacter sp. I-STPA6b TaxID=2585718 RepID=UPI001D0C73CB|nr:tRNA lysidine(34) synthetase TilS [Psychrobacter sp. I-STPA6b]
MPSDEDANMTEIAISQMYKERTAMPLLTALLDSVKAHRQQLRGRRVWLACSGGRDSLSLSAICQQLYLAGQLPFLPQLLHVNHGLQSANATWATQVQAWAQSQGLPCRVLEAQLTGSNEQSAREGRYTAMMQVMNQEDVLILAHHSDDQAETVLMRLFNGAGVSGLAGMRTWSSKSHAGRHICLWRPWLTVSRAQITAYAQQANLPYIDDPTNTLADPTPQIEMNAQRIAEQGNERAWLRSVILPQLHQRYPQLSNNIARSALLCLDASQIVTEQVQADKQKLTELGHRQNRQLADWQAVLDIEALLQLPSARQSALVHLWLTPQCQNRASSSALMVGLPPPKRLVDDVLRLCQRTDGDHQTCLYWQSGTQSYHIRRHQGQLYRLRAEWEDWLAQRPNEQQLVLTPQKSQMMDSVLLKTARCDSIQIEWSIQGMSQLVYLTEICAQSKPREIRLKFEPLPKDLPLRLAGRKGSKSGKKLLQALHQPVFYRPSVVLCSLCVQENTEQDKVDKYDIQKWQPLFLVSITGIAVLQSDYAEQLSALVQSHQLISQVDAHG